MCAESYFYTTTNADIGHFLKFVLTPGQADGRFGPPVEFITKQAVQAGPGPCPFETRHVFTNNRLQGPSIRVVSYNILADLYADSDYTRAVRFPYCPPYALKLEYRRQLFLKEIVGYNADIVCLQEVDMKVFDSDLKAVLETPEQGYRGVIAQKGSCGEGVACFYRKDRFELLQNFELNIGDNIPKLPEFSKLWQKIASNQKLVERICDRATTLQVGNIELLCGFFNSLLQLLLFRTLETDRLVMVANTHLYFHPDADHIRLLQFGFSMLHIQDRLQQLQQEHQKPVALIFCGDFNSVPECGIFKLMTEQFVGEDFIDWQSSKFL